MVIAGLLQTFRFVLKYYFQFKVGDLQILFTLPIQQAVKLAIYAYI